eukprot:CAMPEP_0198204316 /NCGR_PEP_ID=MMETSP1445-20131203/7719_1 /TAXON_ID=36898 /ORGANISM="Pyramimonas sp., Strain CCMP2087" /LENGTH=41 /DNA_ID= /DNA_START= /DNA_END= /DNA_ORIENTATION=
MYNLENTWDSSNMGDALGDTELSLCALGDRICGGRMDLTFK